MLLVWSSSHLCAPVVELPPKDGFPPITQPANFFHPPPTSPLLVPALRSAAPLLKRLCDGSYDCRYFASLPQWLISGMGKWFPFKLFHRALFNQPLYPNSLARYPERCQPYPFPLSSPQTSHPYPSPAPFWRPSPLWYPPTCAFGAYGLSVCALAVSAIWRPPAMSYHLHGNLGGQGSLS